MPGLVDTHVHINEPGRTDWEGFETASRAAAAGGVTTLLDMPLNSLPPTTTTKGLEAKRRAAEGRCFVDVGFWGGLVPGNTEELLPLLDAGVFGFKCFLAPSGVPEFDEVREGDLRAAMPPLVERGALLLVHAELPDRLNLAWNEKRRSYASYLASRPGAAEEEAAALLVRLSRDSGGHIHVLHLSSAEALAPLAEARREGLPITAETCPHYLFFAAEEISDGATQFKCAPPIREASNRESLWKALREGAIGMIVSDHSPAPPGKKMLGSGDFREAWGGISSLELTLAATWTAASERGFSIADVAEWMCRAPARLSGLDRRKGVLAPGADADIVVFRPEESFEVVPEGLHQRHKLTPYSGRILKGVVEATFLRGKRIYDQGGFPAGPIGELLRP
jgi:allantoinase